MEDNVIAFDTTQPLMSDVRQQLPRMAQMLGVKSVDSLAIVDFQYWPSQYMYTEHRDKAIASDGPMKDMPLVARGRLHKAGRVGIGMVLYENRLDPKLKYVVFTCRGQYCDESYVVCRKDELFRLKRNATRLNQRSSQKVDIPILGDGLLEEIVSNTVGFLLQSKKIEKFGVRIKRGIILDGDPGNGKTMLCRYIQKLCAQNNISWGTVTSSDIDAAYEDKQLGDLFTNYTVTFFDDIDVGYMDRKRGNGKMACSLLTAMDGMNDSGHLIRIFTTNEPVGELDAAFTRPGRIDKCFTLEKPTEALRRKLVAKVWPDEIKRAIDVESLITRSHGYSFAELEAIRTFLVTNHTLGDGTWDLDRAFEEFETRRAEKKRKGGKKVGFGSST